MRVPKSVQVRSDKAIAKARRLGLEPPPKHVMPHQRMLKRTMAEYLKGKK